MKLLLVLAAALGGFALYLLLLQHRLIYFPRQYDPTPLPSGVTPINYSTAFGEQTAFYLPPAEDNGLPDRIWLIAGGNASLALDWVFFAKRFPDRRAAFLLFDYPGYGNCEGSASPRTIMDSLDGCLAALAKKLGLPLPDLTQRLSLLGHSLGSAVVLQLALRYPVKKIILVSPFTSMLDMAKLAVPFPFYHLLLHRFDNRKALTKLLAASPQPTIDILHGDRDTIVPVQMARTLAESHRSELQYAEIKGADHNDIIDVAEAKIYQIMTETPRSVKGER